MNILYITQFFSPRGGGPLVFYELARAMSKRGHNVHIICNISTERINIPNLKIHLIKPYLKEEFYHLPTSVIQNLRFIVNSITHGTKIIKNNKVDLIHTNTFAPIIAGNILARLTHKRVIAGVLDVYTGNKLGGWSNWAKFNNVPSYYAHLGKILEKISLWLPSDVYHTISKATMQDIIDVKKNARIKVIYPGIDIAAYSNHNDIEYDDFILFIGRLVFYKNLDVLIDAFQYVIKAPPNAKLVIVGEGPMKEAWKTKALNAGLGRNVQFLGNISTPEKIILLKKCLALALPSVFEGFGLVLLEAFAMSKPVLVSKIKPFDEIVDDNLDGFILPIDNPLLWAQKIQYLLQDKDNCRKMGKTGFPKNYDKFSFERSMDQMEMLYHEVVDTCKKKV